MKKFFASILAIAFALSLCAIAASADAFQGTGEKIPAEFVVPQANGLPNIDGIMEPEFWGEPIMTAIGKARYEDEMYVHPRSGYTDEQYNAVAGITANYYFRWDKDYLYILVQNNRIFSSEITESGQHFSNTCDILQYAIGQTTEIEPHLGFALSAPQDLTETFVNVFEPMAGTEAATAQELIIGKIGYKDGMTTFEVAIPWADALALDGKIGTVFGFSAAFFFNNVEHAGLAWQLGRGTFWADKDYNFIPFGTLGAALPAAEAAAEAAPEAAPEATPEATPEAAPEATPEVDVPKADDKNPPTSDISVIFYALAAVSAVGGLSIFKKR